MSLQVEKMEKNMAKLTIEVSAEDLDKAMRMHIRKLRAKSLSLASVKAKHREK